MASASEIRKKRIEKLKKIISWGINPYPRNVKRTCSISKALEKFSDLKKKKREIFLTGRIIAKRGHGGAIFVDIQDGTGKIQALFRKDKIGEKGFDFFKDIFDIGDFRILSK